VIFGGNHFADKLPPSACWLVWDKIYGLETDKRELGFCDSADCELAWTNLSGVARIIRCKWTGMMKDTERNQRRVHPTQKPIEVMKRIILAYAEKGDLILDPYAGSFTTLVAAKELEYRAVGIEISKEYCEIGITRLRQEVIKFKEN
jgi:DNA modification methylase